MDWRSTVLVLGLAIPLLPSLALGQAPLLDGLGGPVGYGTDLLPADDDGSSASISLATAFPSGLEFFGTRHTEVFVNTNGNISFNLPLSAFTPMPFPVATQPIVAGWWADADTRGMAPVNENRVYWNVSPGRFVATWYRVGYFDSHTDRVNSFQIVLTDQSALGAAGDFDVELRYNELAWTTGDASGGVGGVGGTPAQAGFDAGNGTDFFALPGSLTMTIVDLVSTSNVGTPGVWRFQIRSGGLTACGNGVLEAGEECDDSNTTPGDGCGARCNAESPPGDPCASDVDCSSGFCAATICCDQRCDGNCEFCAADGACTPRPSGEPCRESGGLCDAREACDGVSGICPPDAAEPDGFPCGDGLICNGDETCLGGVCSVGTPPDCDDGDPCTVDGCAEDRACTNERTPGCGVDAGLGDDAGPPGDLDSGVGVDAAADPGVPRGSGLTCSTSTASGASRSPVAAFVLLLAGFVVRRRMHHSRRSGPPSS